MMFCSQYSGVYFVEGHPSNAQVIAPVSTEINGAFRQSQLMSLDDIKNLMAIEARKVGGNAIIDFVYGQRSTFWKSLLGLDDVFWYGKGKIAKIDFTSAEAT